MFVGRVNAHSESTSRPSATTDTSRSSHLTASNVLAGILQCSNALMPYSPNASCRVLPQIVSLKPMLL